MINDIKYFLFSALTVNFSQVMLLFIASYIVSILCMIMILNVVSVFYYGYCECVHLLMLLKLLFTASYSIISILCMIMI